MGEQSKRKINEKSLNQKPQKRGTFGKEAEITIVRQLVAVPEEDELLGHQSKKIKGLFWHELQSLNISETRHLRRFQTSVRSFLRRIPRVLV